MFDGSFISLKGLSLGFSVGFGVFIIKWAFNLVMHTLYENERGIEC